MKTRAFSHPVDLGSLRERISVRAGVRLPSRSKLPSWVKLDFTVELRSNVWDFTVKPPLRHVPFEGFHRIHVIPADRQGKPRIFLLCECAKLVPIGRVAQHTHEARFGTIQLVTKKQT